MSTLNTNESMRGLSSIKKGGYLLISEPSHHVSNKDFNATVEIAQQTSFKVKEYLNIKGSYSVLLVA